MQVTTSVVGELFAGNSQPFKIKIVDPAVGHGGELKETIYFQLERSGENIGLVFHEHTFGAFVASLREALDAYDAQ